MSQLGLPPPRASTTLANEHDACGVGFIANFKGEKSHQLVQRGIDIELCT